jgi:iron complex outermembrane receptor protein
MASVRATRIGPLACAAALLSLAGATASQAQVATGAPSTTEPSATKEPVPESTSLSDIIVTGAKTGAERLQSTPIAVSVVDSALLENQGLATVQDIARYVPNLSFSRNTGAALIYIRGIGSGNAGAGSDPSVTQQIDGVYIARATGHLTDFFDVDRIEVLRGPQGTLYGRNAVGGTINVLSRQPSSTFSGRVRVGYGNYDSKSIEGFVTGPISGDVVTASLAMNFRDRDAFFNNVVPGGADVGSAHRFGVRGQIRLQPTADFDFTLRADYSLVDEVFESYDHLVRPVPFNAPLANALVGSYRDVAVDQRQSIRNDLGGVSGEANWRLGGGFALKSITAWRSTKIDFNNDNDATDLFVQHARTTETDKQFSQEFNLNYSKDRVKGVAGLYYFGDRDVQVNRAVVPVSVATPPVRTQIATAAPIVETRSYAAFAQVNYEVLSELSLILGARYTSEKKSIAQAFTRTSLNPGTLGASLPGFPAIFTAERRDEAFTPKFGVDFQATRDLFFYASATRGFKSGGYNNAGTSVATVGFNPEKIWSYEAGAKTEFLSRRLRVNLTAFQYDYTDLQVRQFLSVGNAVITNAASAKVRGLEIEVLAKPTADIQLTANTSFLDAKYRSFPNASIPGGFAAYTPNQICVAGVCTINASGNRLDNAPRGSGVVAIDYSPRLADLRLAAHLDYTWRTRAFYDPSNIEIASQKGYGLFNANIGVGPDRGWKLELFVNNLADKKYYVIVAGNGLAPGAIVGEPRTYGIRAGYTW